MIKWSQKNNITWNWHHENKILKIKIMKKWCEKSRNIEKLFGEFLNFMLYLFSVIRNLLRNRDWKRTRQGRILARHLCFDRGLNTLLLIVAKQGKVLPSLGQQIVATSSSRNLPLRILLLFTFLSRSGPNFCCHSTKLFATPYMFYGPSAIIKSDFLYPPPMIFVGRG